MKKMLPTGFIISMLILSTNAFGQTKRTEIVENKEVKKTAKTYLDLMVNVVSTNLNYGESNSGMSDYKKSNNGI